MKDIAKISEARKMKYCRILLCMTALAACLMIGIAWGEDYLEGGYVRSYDRSMMMDPGIAGMVQWLDTPVPNFPWYSSNLAFYRQAVPSSTFTPYREYYQFNPGYNTMNFKAEQMGRNMLYFVVNNQPSNVVIVDVFSQAPG